jgi:hypothetical protein
MKVFQIVVSESDLLSRCVKCNGEFTPRPLTSAEAKTQAPAAQEVPKSVLETCEEYWQCCVCGHLFWQVSSLCPYRQRHRWFNKHFLDYKTWKPYIFMFSTKFINTYKLSVDVMCLEISN